MKHLSKIASSVFVVVAGLAVAQTPSDPLVRQTFKETQGGWTVFGTTATLAVTHDAPVVEPGNGALKFGYSVAKGDLSALVFPTDIGSITRAKSVKFRIRTDATTMIAVMLQEQDGGRYVAMCNAPKDRWQPIELSTDDFALAQEKDDPKDPDGKLDMDRVSGIVVTDVAQMFAQSDDAGLRSLIGVKTGSHTLYIDDFTVGADPIHTSMVTAAGDIVLDTFAHPQLAWFGLGGGDLSRSSGKPLEGLAVKFDYHQTPNKISLLSKGIAPGTLTGTKSLSLDMASSQPAKLVIQVEETDGGKYNMMIDLPGGSVSNHVNLPFDAFKVADDSKDANGKLDLENIKTLLILDGSGIMDQADHDNTLWVGHVVAHK